MEKHHFVITIKTTPNSCDVLVNGILDFRTKLGMERANEYSNWLVGYLNRRKNHSAERQ